MIFKKKDDDVDYLKSVLKTKIKTNDNLAKIYRDEIESLKRKKIELDFYIDQLVAKNNEAKALVESANKMFSKVKNQIEKESDHEV